MPLAGSERAVQRGEDDDAHGDDDGGNEQGQRFFDTLTASVAAAIAPIVLSAINTAPCGAPAHHA